MHCNRRTLSEYVDGELGRSESQTLEQHLGTCDRCRETLSEYRAIGHKIRGLPRYPAPARLKADILAAFERQPLGKQTPLAALYGFRTTAMAALLVLGLAFIALNLSQRLFYAGPSADAGFPAGFATANPSPESISARFGPPTDRASVARSTRSGPSTEAEYNWTENQQTTLAPRSSVALTATAALGCRVAVGTLIGRIYQYLPELRARLGCADQPEQTLLLAEEPFQTGHMLWRSDKRLVYVLHINETWVAFSDESFGTKDEPFEERPASSTGLVEPTRGFGKVWRGNPAVKVALGWATGLDRGFTGSLQAFERGVALGTDQQIAYVLYHDGRLLRFADRPQ